MGGDGRFLKLGVKILSVGLTIDPTHSTGEFDKILG